jgi:hypothetical protein
MTRSKGATRRNGRVKKNRAALVLSKHSLRVSSTYATRNNKRSGMMITFFLGVPILYIAVGQGTRTRPTNFFLFLLVSTSKASTNY